MGYTCREKISIWWVETLLPYPKIEEDWGSERANFKTRPSMPALPGECTITPNPLRLSYSTTNTVDLLEQIMPGRIPLTTGNVSKKVGRYTRTTTDGPSTEAIKSGSLEIDGFLTWNPFDLKFKGPST